MKLTALFPFIFVWLWSTGFIGAKYGLPYIEPHFMLTLRFGCAILLLMILARLFRERRLEAREKRGQIAVGALLHGAYLGGVFFAIKAGMSAGVVAIIVGLQPLLTALISRLWFGERLHGLQKLGMALGFTGTTLVIFGAGKLGDLSTSLPALAACVIALIGISFGSVLQKSAGQNLPLLGGASYQYLGAICVVGCLTALTETQTVVPSIELAMAMGWLVLGLSISALLLLMVVIRTGVMAQVASYFYLVPPATVLQAWLLFGERLGATAILGCIVTGVGVFCVITPKARPERWHTALFPSARKFSLLEQKNV